MTTVNPYLNFNGNCELAFNFYKSVFGGDFQHIGRFAEMPKDLGFEIEESQKEKIMHISLPISKETVLFGCDMLDKSTDVENIKRNFSISIQTEKAEARRLFNLLSEGGSVEMAFDKTFWGSYFGMCTDKYGIHWMLNSI